MPEPTGTTGAMPAANAGATPGDTTTPAQNQQQPSATPASFDDWLKGQDETVKSLITQRFTGLENTVKATRTEREDLAKQLKDAAKKMEAGSEAQKALEAVSAKLDAAEMRAAFFEEAAKPEIGCSNPRLAMLGAQEIGAIDQKGRINWDAVKSAFPELFRKTAVPGNAGAGTLAAPPGGTTTMNDYIRRAAGKQ